MSHCLAFRCNNHPDKKLSGLPFQKRFEFLTEPVKYLPFGESTYSDHFGPKLNLPPPHQEGTIPIPLACARAKHLVSTTQQDYDGRTTGTYSGDVFHKRTEDADINALMLPFKESADEIFTTVGPVPLVKSCRQRQGWETTYAKDYEYFPGKERMFPFPQ